MFIDVAVAAGVDGFIVPDGEEEDEEEQEEQEEDDFAFGDQDKDIVMHDDEDESGEDLDDMLVEAFAVTREAADRTLGQRHFDVQMMGGAALHFVAFLNFRAARLRLRGQVSHLLEGKREEES